MDEQNIISIVNDDLSVTQLTFDGQTLRTNDNVDIRLWTNQDEYNYTQLTATPFDYRNAVISNDDTYSISMGEIVDNKIEKLEKENKELRKLIANLSSDFYTLIGKLQSENDVRI